MQVQKKRQTFTNEDKQKLLDDYTRSPLSVQKFAAMSGVGASTFERWRRESSVDVAPNIANLPSTTDTANLFFELTQPIEPQVVNNFPDNYKAKDCAQKSAPPNNSIACVIATPNGITITVEAIKAEQLAQVVQGLLP